MSSPVPARISLCQVLLLLCAGLLWACAEGSPVDQAQRLIADGQCEAALKILQQTLAADSTNGQAHFLKLKAILLRTSNYNKAIALEEVDALAQWPDTQVLRWVKEELILNTHATLNFFAGLTLWAIQGEMAGEMVSKAMLRGLEHEDPWVRARAVEVLGALSRFNESYQDRYFIPVVRLLQDTDPLVRVTAAAALADFTSTEGYQVALDGLGDHNPKVQLAAIHALERIGKQAAADSLRPFLKHSNTRLAVAATGALGALRVATATSLLTSVLAAEPLDLRLEALAAAGQCKAVEHLGVIMASLTAPSPQVRAEAARALGRMRSTEALPALIKAFGDSHWRVREAVAGALGNIRRINPTSQQIDALVAALVDRSERVQVAVLRALARFGPDAVPALIKALHSDLPRMRVQAAILLARLQDPRAVPALLARLGDSQATVRNFCATALIGIDDRRIVPALIKKLTTSQGTERLMSARILGQKQAQEAVPVLKEMLDQSPSDKALVFVLQEALYQITGTTYPPP